MAEDAIKSAKLDRRTAKATLTRCRKALSKRIEIKRPGTEVQDALDSLQNAFHDLVVKHENYSKVIEDDEEFEVQERWMEESQELFMDTEIQAKIYLENLATKGKGPLKTGFAEINTSSAEPEDSVSGISSMQSSEKKGIVDDSSPNPNPDPAEINEVVDIENSANNSAEQTDRHDIQSTGSVDISQAPQSHHNNSIVTETGNSGDNDNSAARGFKMEKPKMPKFTEDVQEYAI